jgi:hypothetical protein
MKQKDIVAKIRDLDYKVTVLNAHSSNRGGIPDTLISIDGKAMFVEIKINTDEPSALQIDFMEEFHQCTFRLHYDSKEKLYTGYGMEKSKHYCLWITFLQIIHKLNGWVKRGSR